MQRVDGKAFGQNPTLTEPQIDCRVVGHSPTVAYIYCDNLGQTLQTPLNLLDSLLRQLAVTFPSVPDEITQLYEKCRREGKSLELGDVDTLLLHQCQSSKVRVYTCVSVRSTNTTF